VPLAQDRQLNFSLTALHFRDLSVPCDGSFGEHLQTNKRPLALTHKQRPEQGKCVSIYAARQNFLGVGHRRIGGCGLGLPSKSTSAVQMREDGFAAFLFILAGVVVIAFALSWPDFKAMWDSRDFVGAFLSLPASHWFLFRGIGSRAKGDEPWSTVFKKSTPKAASEQIPTAAAIAAEIDKLEQARIAKELKSPKASSAKPQSPIFNPTPSIRQARINVFNIHFMPPNVVGDSATCTGFWGELEPMHDRQRSRLVQIPVGPDKP